MKTTKIFALLLAASLTCTLFFSCNKNSEGSGDNNGGINLPENENKTEEIITNENYASSELISFEGTVDEIYEDGSMLIYSPFFGVNYNYAAIVELDENSVIDGFEVKKNHQIRFDVYSAVKKSEPLTVVASKLSLVKEVSTQREEEAARIEKVQQAAEEYKNGNSKD